MNTLGGLVKLTIRVLKGTLIVEGIGALLLSFQFIPEYGVPLGIWKSVFHSISAFCNAGIDLIGENGYARFAIDGLEDTNHIYRRNTDWVKIVQNATAYIAAGGRAEWDFIVFAHNAPPNTTIALGNGAEFLELPNFKRPLINSISPFIA